MSTPAHNSSTGRVESVAHDALSVVDGVGRVLARYDGGDHETGYAEALRILADGFSATLTAVLRFEEDGAHVTALWAGGRYVRDPQIRLGNDLLPTDAPLRSRREPLVLTPEAFGPSFGAMLREFGEDQSLLVAPISDANLVDGAVAVLAPRAGEFGVDERVALQLCGELLWRHMRHHQTLRDLHERAEIAEMLAGIGARLHEGGVEQARQLLDEVFTVVGGHVGADVIDFYERVGNRATSLVTWPADDRDHRPAPMDLEVEEWQRIEQGPILWSELVTDPLVERVGGMNRAGVVVPGDENGQLVGLFVFAKLDNRPFTDAQIEFITSTVRLLGQFRVRMGGELALVRRGVVEQCRTDLAEAFVNAPAASIEDTLKAALQRIGEVFSAHRVRWVELDGPGVSARVGLDWSDGSRPELPREFRLDRSIVDTVGDRRQPFLLRPNEILETFHIEAMSPTLLVPTVVGDEIRAVLTLTGESFENELPADERRALMDLAGLVHQARLRALQQLEADYRGTLDDLQLRLARRFLDRTVSDHGPVVDWVLGELGEVLECDLIAFAEYLGAYEGEMHWWARDSGSTGVAERLNSRGDVFSDHFSRCLETGEPMAIRSRVLPDELRRAAEEIAGGDFSMLVVPFRAPGVALLLGVCSLSDREWQGVERSLLQQVIGQMRQFIDVVAGRRQLEYDAGHDSLTGLANRRKMAEEFGTLLDDERRGAMLMIDVDRFKVVNDSLGHSAGDSVLVTIADRIRTSVREGDLVGRLGGDEFAVLMRGSVDDLVLASTADRLIGVIREPIRVRGTTVIPTCSIGIAGYAEGDDVESLLRHADAALYDAKAKGRDRYEFFDDSYRQTLTERLHLETALRRGVAEGEFVPWFQPEYDLGTGEIVGVEALVRWNHPTDGVLDACRFIDVAEEIGLAPEMSRLVLRGSVEALRGWIDEGFRTRVRINVAAAQLQSRELAQQISAALAEFDIPADMFCIEITERSLMLDAETAIEALEEVRDLGVEVAVDDFGTGFSSLARLKHLPVDTLKIDRSFVSGIVGSETDREIVRTIIWLCRGLGLDVVAEGVEDDDQVRMLLELGCHRAQGWLWSPAVPAAEVPRFARV